MIETIPKAKNAQRILIVKSSSLGDICNALPVADAIRLERPTSTIGWVVKEPFRPIIAANPNVDKTYTFPRGELWRAIKAGLAARKDGYDVALDLQTLFVSSLIARLSGAKIRIGYDTKKEGSSLFLNYPIVRGASRDRKAVDLMLDFARAIGVEDPKFRPQNWLAHARRNEADLLMTIVSKPYAALFVGATTPQRQWSFQRWGELSDALCERGITPVFVGASSDQGATVSARHHTKRTSYSLVGRTDLMTLAAVLAGAQVAIGGDSGPLHMAVAVGTPVVGLYGPTDPQTTGPYGDAAETVYNKQPCSPCYRKPTCGGAYFCMAAIEAEMALKKTHDLLKRRELI